MTQGNATALLFWTGALLVTTWVGFTYGSLAWTGAVGAAVILFVVLKVWANK